MHYYTTLKSQTTIHALVVLRLLQKPLGIIQETNYILLVFVNCICSPYLSKPVTGKAFVQTTDFSKKSICIPCEMS